MAFRYTYLHTQTRAGVVCMQQYRPETQLCVTYKDKANSFGHKFREENVY